MNMQYALGKRNVVLNRKKQDNCGCLRNCQYRVDFFFFFFFSMMVSESKVMRDSFTRCIKSVFMVYTKNRIHEIIRKKVYNVKK